VDRSSIADAIEEATGTMAARLNRKISSAGQSSAPAAMPKGTMIQSAFTYLLPHVALMVFSEYQFNRVDRRRIRCGLGGSDSIVDAEAPTAGISTIV
jgi:hypothetical protein